VELVRALKFGGEAVQAADVLEALEPDVDTPDRELRELVELEHIGLAYISEGRASGWRRGSRRCATRVASREPGSRRSSSPGWRSMPPRAAFDLPPRLLSSLRARWRTTSSRSTRWRAATAC
jgi:hypothetical protein